VLEHRGPTPAAAPGAAAPSAAPAPAPAAPGAADPGAAAREPGGPIPAAPDGGPARPTLAVFDIDGVLADVRHRLHHVATRPKDWDAFFGAAPLDPPLAEGLSAVATAARAGHAVAYLTGRPERCREATLRWLAAQGLPAGALHMRDDADRRPARLTKVATLRRLARRATIVAFVDDDAAVVEAVRGAGFPVLHADWMGSATPGAGTSGTATSGTPGAGGTVCQPSAQEVLFEIQEAEGRT
jgi:phosphoglycolate phosphatase-like HAD superfamily hydrolase